VTALYSCSLDSDYGRNAIIVLPIGAPSARQSVPCLRLRPSRNWKAV